MKVNSQLSHKLVIICVYCIIIVLYIAFLHDDWLAVVVIYI